MTIGEKVRQLRKQTKLNLRDFAKLVGRDYSQINRIENENDSHYKKPPQPSLDMLRDICKGAGYDFATFLEETGYIEKKSPTVALVEDERETYIIDIFRALPPNLQKIMIAQAEGIVDNYGIKVEYRKAQGVS